ncbi:hypothetical protein RN001_016108 [Aquatica leii]|uniref:Uncharacterized protein n=1 Tax=Aquatica leii TaxID=1421715 RepID=A0AAN7PMV0_9COLE|nr:hypothetical protein RN001_016108 [Aquatica leii]
MRKEKFKIPKTPLCVFSLSPAFTLQEFSGNVEPATRRLTTPFWRRSEHSVSPNRPRFKPYKTYSHTLAKYLTGRVVSKQKNSLTLQEVLNTLKEVWISPSSLQKTFSSTNMDERLLKKNSTPADGSSPVLLRRRLSAPETIMRKHMLVQQRSQDGDSAHNSDVRSCNWRLENGVGSDPNLSKKRDVGFMRRSTLMRRLWGSHKPLSERSCRFSSYYDWQHGKSSLSLSSNNSSPEHIKCKCKYLSDDSKSLSKRCQGPKFSQSLDLKKVPSVDKISNRRSYSEQSSQVPESKNSCCSNCTNATVPEIPSSSYESRTKTIETESEMYSTRSTITDTTENSDSAYTNTRSNITHSSSDVYSNTYSTEKFIAENGNASETQCKNNQVKQKLIPEKVSDSSTQTTSTTNLNVISNIQLSQATLNLIFNQVLQDVQKSPQTNINISTVSAGITPSRSNAALLKPQIIQVKQVPSFYLNNAESNTCSKDQQHRVLKYMVGNVGTGSSYCKTAENPQVVVPRYSALPRTTSMEVNTSSAESSDRESDNLSLVDSLEGSWSPCIDVNQNKFRDKPMSPLLPDNSVKVSEKSSVFFIPIETNTDTIVKSVADHLPDRVRERLSKRQIKRQQKFREAKDKVVSPKSDSNYISASDNGNVQCNINNNQYGNSSMPSNLNYNKVKKKNKPLLPNIDSYRRTKNVAKPNTKNQEETDNIKEKKIRKRRTQESTTEKPSVGISRVLEKLSPLCASKKDFPYNVIPNRIYHKTELSNSNKHIEILEIVECIGTIPNRSTKRYSKSKHSKIPILVQSKLPSISRDFSDQKPTFLDFDQAHKDDPKVDQLIANILIDALNKTDSPEDKTKVVVSKVEKRPPASQLSQMRQGTKYQQKFEVIPEERGSVKASSEDASNSSENGNDTINNDNRRGLEKSADVRVEKPVNKNLSATSENWVTFYTVRKNEGSPDSTLDEGRKEKLSSERTHNNHHFKNIVDHSETSKSHNVQHNYNQTHVVPKDTMHDSLDCWSSSDQEKRMKVLYPLPSIYRKNQQKKSKLENSETYGTNKSKTGEWTVTVSGVTSGKEFAPDLEMRLIFPQNQSNCKPQNDNHRNVAFNKKCRTGTSRTENMRTMHQLPDIGKHKSAKPSMGCDSGCLADTTRESGTIEPRQTRTSTRRLLLNRPRTFTDSSSYMEVNVEDNSFKDILQKFPGILKITGSAISPERKPKLPSMTERDVTRHLHRNS